MTESAEALQAHIQSVQALGAVPTLLQVLCDTTGMGFAAVARVTDDDWTACAVIDRVGFGLKAGEHLDVHTTLCKEARQARAPVVIDHASQDAVYRDHHTPRIYHIESYVSVPIVLPGGEYFGNLCAIDASPAEVSNPKVLSMFSRFAELIGVQLAIEMHRDATAAVLTSERLAGELREQFVAVLGHDLRTPVGAVLASSALLERRADDPAVVREVAAKLRLSGRRMSSLIDDVLDFTRVRLGDSLGVSRDAVVELGAKLEEVVSELRQVHPDRAIDSDIDIDAPLEIRCDPGRLQQLASNLIANALAHGAVDSPIRFSARVQADELVISVWNDGEAIPEATLANIFKPFWRSSTSRNRQGLGLGLHICSEIVAAHDGRLTVRSVVGEGTTFTATMPVAGHP